MAALDPTGLQLFMDFTSLSIEFAQLEEARHDRRPSTVQRARHYVILLRYAQLTKRLKAWIKKQQESTKSELFRSIKSQQSTTPTVTLMGRDFKFLDFKQPDGPNIIQIFRSFTGTHRSIAKTILRGTPYALSRNLFTAGADQLPNLFNRTISARSASRAASTAAADTDSGGGGPDDPDPDPDPERPYIALGIDHKATTPAGPPVLAVLRPFTDPNTVTARLCQYDQPKHPEPQGSNFPPP